MSRYIRERSQVVGAILRGKWTLVKDGSDLHDRRHDFESIGEILTRLRRERRALERSMGRAFDAALSLHLDILLQREEAVAILEEADR
jgi:hypothetical protein